MKYRVSENHRITLATNNDAHTYTVRFDTHSDAMLAMELLDFCKIKYEKKDAVTTTGNWTAASPTFLSSGANVAGNIVTYKQETTKAKGNNIWKTLKRAKNGRFKKRARKK